MVSKTYGLPGLRIGWVSTQNRDVFNKMAAFKDYTSICNSAPSEFLAEVALRHRQVLVKRNIKLLKDNLSILDGFFVRHADLFSWVKPKAGSIGFPKLLRGEIEPFCHELVTRQGVLLLPGTLFDDSDNHFRLGYGRKNMPQAVEQLELFLKDAFST